MGCEDGLAHGTKSGHPRQPELPLAPGGMEQQKRQPEHLAEEWGAAVLKNAGIGGGGKRAVLFLDVLNVDSPRTTTGMSV